ITKRLKKIQWNDQEDEICRDLWIIHTFKEEDEVERNEVDSDLESTASRKPVWEKTTKDRASHHCPFCLK
ncbi:hypothetical protein Tco_0314990, partial [Tanacetum coccineum]